MQIKGPSLLLTHTHLGRQLLNTFSQFVDPLKGNVGSKTTSPLIIKGQGFLYVWTWGHPLANTYRNKLLNQKMGFFTLRKQRYHPYPLIVSLRDNRKGLNIPPLVRVLQFAHHSLSVLSTRRSLAQIKFGNFLADPMVSQFKFGLERGSNL